VGVAQLVEAVGDLGVQDPAERDFLVLLHGGELATGMRPPRGLVAVHRFADSSASSGMPKAGLGCSSTRSTIAEAGTEPGAPSIGSLHSALLGKAITSSME